jgi:hypothetical protein
MLTQWWAGREMRLTELPMPDLGQIKQEKQERNLRERFDAER